MTPRQLFRLSLKLQRIVSELEEANDKLDEAGIAGVSLDGLNWAIKDVSVRIKKETEKHGIRPETTGARR